ncbi:fungal hydrophobin [Dichomitus squalens]|uniref:Hydrophobin n=1 Tax=Dichomitus squalens TaxID=114155 RepID=A0A4Q9NSD0_9APHY|nr:fungal hydrophobin [Dichomitus squalens]TBU44198.1 fungal hydrophobin [Dichomitus squalens]TBU61487.1 fungal hydrophobin [Dichomitus squalens]
MFSRLAAFVVVALPILAAATPLEGRNEPASSCATAPVQCCDTVEKASDPSISKELGLLGVVVQDVDALVGLTCSPITVIGVGSGSSCSANAVCCDDNSFGGLVSIGCVPVDL